MHRLASKRVPESDAPVSSATSAAHLAVNVRVPGYGLDCSNVLGELHDRLLVVGLAPDQKLVIVASRG